MCFFFASLSERQGRALPSSITGSCGSANNQLASSIKSGKRGYCVSKGPCPGSEQIGRCVTLLP